MSSRKIFRKQKIRGSMLALETLLKISQQSVLTGKPFQWEPELDWETQQSSKLHKSVKNVTTNAPFTIRPETASCQKKGFLPEF